MPVGVLVVEVHLPYAESLKDRRMVVQGLKDRLRRKFNVSVAEIGDSELWQRATVGIAAISGDREYLNGLLARAGDEALAILRGQDASLGEIEILD
jgi:uncharacterized protein YlxP (DUF503 family)